MKRISLKITNLSRCYNFSIDNIIGASIIIGIVLALAIIIITNIAFQYYENGNYFNYIIVLNIALIVLTPACTLFMFPVIYLINLFYVLLLLHKASTLSVDTQKELIDSLIKEKDIKSISAERLSDVLLLPTENVSKHLNSLIADDKAELSITPKGILLYSFTPNISNLVNKIARRIFDAN